VNRRPMRRRAPIRRRPTAWWAVVIASLLVLTTGCGFDAQTLQPYTPADGVNFQLGGTEADEPTLKVRNLLVIADDTGAGFVSASMVVDLGTDTLRSITGVALNANGTDAGAITVSAFPPVPLNANQLVVLTNLAPISVSGPLKPGLEARLVFTFAQAGEQTIVVPVLDRSDPVYAGVTPSPAASASTTG